MPQWIEVEPIDAIKPGQLRDYELLDGTMLGIANVDGTFYAFDARCPHEGGPLTGGRLAEGQLRCPWHGYRFRLTDGCAIEPAIPLALRRFPVRVREGRLEVEIP